MSENKDEKSVWDKLAAPFHPSDVKYRMQALNGEGNKALVLPYISSRACMDRLDQTVGPFGWFDSYDEVKPGNVELSAATATVGGIDFNGKQTSKAAAKLIEDYYQRGFKCRLSVKVGDDWITKEGTAPFTDVSSMKGGESGALKRAAVKYGIGRYLYNLQQIWVPVLTSFQPGLESSYYKGKTYYYPKPDLRNFGAGDPGTRDEVIPVVLGQPSPPNLFGEPANTGSVTTPPAGTGAPTAISEAELNDLLARISAVIQNNKDSMGMYRQINDQPSSLDKLSKMLGCLYFVSAAAVPGGQHEGRIKSVMTTKSFGEMYSALKDILSDMESGIYK